MPERLEACGSAQASRAGNSFRYAWPVNVGARAARQMYTSRVTATPQIAALLLALLQIGTPVSDQVEKSSAAECPEPPSQAREELNQLRTEWVEEISTADSVEDALLEIIGSYEMAEFFVLTNAEMNRDLDLPKSGPQQDFAMRLVSRVPRAQRGSVPGLLGSLTRIEDALVTMRSSTAARLAESDAFKKSQAERLSTPEAAYETLNEACFGVHQPAAVQRRFRSMLMFTIATIISGEVSRAPESMSSERLADFFETWERLASETAASFELVALLSSDEPPELSRDAAANLTDVVNGYARRGTLMVALVQDAEAQIDPHAPPRMGPLGEESA